MRSAMSLKSHEVGHGRRAALELFRPPSPQMSALDPQAAIKRGMADFRVVPIADIASTFVQVPHSGNLAPLRRRGLSLSRTLSSPSLTGSRL